MSDQWYKIDNTGKIFHALSNAENSFVFRVSMILTERIDREVLQQALDQIVRRFPTLTVSLRKGLFWDYLEKNDQKLMVQEEETYPCAPINLKTSSGYLIRVIYYNNRISFEVFHSLTDGSGAMEFLKTLVYQYLLLKRKNIHHDNMILLPQDLPGTEEIEDSFEKYAYKNDRKSIRMKEDPAYQITGTALDTAGISVIHGIMDGNALNRHAKGHSTTLTAFLTALLIKVISNQHTGHEPIAVALPVNLRRQFPSRTMRNFFAVANIGVKVEDDTNFEEILDEVAMKLVSRTAKESLQKGINHHFQLQRGMMTRIIPIFLKYPAMRYGFNHIGERTKSMTLSNMGNVKLPKSMEAYVERMDIALYPTSRSPISCAAGTINGRMTITFTLSIAETDIVRDFFIELKRLTGLEIEINSNEWGNSNEPL
ncbi:alcohol acetyltransferase [Salinicoccus cyprini]|uniref:Alcohol acetyltransferase n=1 Tax=Salinicoccus cyprini TaxID=2493691 RepID=A0A558B021_9STAP|nr:alcohol acetyltransferase [Salinicoccus cyprini]